VGKVIQGAARREKRKETQRCSIRRDCVDGNGYAAGESYGIGGNDDFTVISPDSNLGVQENNTIIKNNSLNAIVFKGPLVLPKDKTCKVFDIIGRVVEPDRVNPGIYFIEVDGVVTQKVVKVR